MEKQWLVTVLVCLALVACEPHSSPQKPKTSENAAAGSILLPMPFSR